MTRHATAGRLIYCDIRRLARVFSSSSFAAAVHRPRTSFPESVPPGSKEVGPKCSLGQLDEAACVANCSVALIWYRKQILGVFALAAEAALPFWQVFDEQVLLVVPAMKIAVLTACLSDSRVTAQWPDTLDI